jgi:hypothetical protein
MFLERNSRNLDVRTAHGIMANSGTRCGRLLPPDRVGRSTGVRRTSGRVGRGGREVASGIDRTGLVRLAGERSGDLRQLTIELVPPRYLKR